MKSRVLSVDLGASSGRVGLISLAEDRLELEILYRFDNRIERSNNFQVWDLDSIFAHVLSGVDVARSRSYTPLAIGVDTWGVDYVLLDKEGQRVAPAISYRDPRVHGLPSQLEEKEGLSLRQLYQYTGIQVMDLNTIFQLLAQKYQDPAILKKCDKLLFLPDYFHYLLSGVWSNEYSQATTSQMIDTARADWRPELLRLVGLQREQLPPLRHPGSILGPIRPQLVERFGCQPQVIAPPSHDTSSAVLACPIDNAQDWAFISSGTWSLLGCELEAPLISTQAEQANFSNEGGAGVTTFLKNITGMWLMQQVYAEQQQRYSYLELEKMAQECPPVNIFLNPSAAEFYNPSQPISQVIQRYCLTYQQPQPANLAQLVRAIYQNLALLYAYELARLTQLTGKIFQRLHIIGGGCQSSLLNQLTADCCEIPVYAGPSEAATLGNAICQLHALGKLDSLQHGREILARSFPPRLFRPQKQWEQQRQGFAVVASQGY